MIDKAFADRFADEWIAAWNAHDLARILTHYTDDFEMTSPVIVKLTGESSGTLKGKAAVGAYWARALESSPDLHFELIDTLFGVHSVTLYYRGVRGSAAEVFLFNTEGKVTRAYAHYTQAIS